MTAVAPITEIELCGASTLRIYKGFMCAGATFLIFVGGVVLVDGFRTSSEQALSQFIVGALVLLSAGFTLYRAFSLTQVVASANGLRAGDIQIQWSEVRSLVVRSQSHTTVRYNRGSIATLYLLPWPPSVPDHLKQVVTWWREQAEVETQWRPLGQSFRAVRRQEKPHAV